MKTSTQQLVLHAANEERDPIFNRDAVLSQLPANTTTTVSAFVRNSSKEEISKILSDLFSSFTDQDLSSTGRDRNNFRRSLRLGRFLTDTSESTHTVLLEAPRAADLPFTVLKMFKFVQAVCRDAIAQHRILPIALIDERVASTHFLNDSYRGLPVFPEGPDALKAQLKAEGIIIVPVLEETFIEDVRAGLKEVLEGKLPSFTRQERVA